MSAMSKGKSICVVCLAVLAGLLAGFGVGNFPPNRAEALTPLATPAANSSSAVTAAVTTGVGGNFVSEVYKAVSPTVVHITNKSTQVAFGFWGPQQYESEATGSGVIVEDSGYILTNHHVIAGAEEIIVILNDGREFTATIIGQDPGTDLALIKVDADATLPAATLGDSSQIEVGEWVVAIGNPRGYDWTVTAGVISALDREIVSMTGQTMRGLIQTDASINPGNSGGPLLNARGEVIGINELIVSGSGGSEGIGLAIPINTVKLVLDDLVRHGRVIRAWLGIEPYEITAHTARRNNLPVDYGVVPTNVFKDSPAALSGLERYYANQRTGKVHFDIITAIDDERVDSERKLLDIIREHKSGDIIKVDIYRVFDHQYEAKKIEVTLAELPAEAPMLGVI
jgi:S1-C subfamily serine protease